jgi:murein DD-endopeptidase MepM/ murein hydrolase activator NlpD
LFFFSLLLTGNALAAKITAEPSRGPVGSKVTVKGTAWPPGDLIELSWDFDPFVPVESIQANGNGAFTTTITVPQSAPIEPTYVDAINEAGDITGQAPFTVDALQLQLPWPTRKKHYIWSGGSGYNCDYHQSPRDEFAIDFQFAKGDPVSAVAAGIAHQVPDDADHNTGYGNLVWIQHEGGMVSLYAHLSEFVGKDNVSVKRGQTIGKAGKTGGENITGPHLHFALRGNATDWEAGQSLLPEPMSGYIGFSQYGHCVGVQSPEYTSKVPKTPIVELQSAWLWDDNDQPKGDPSV